MTRVLGIPLLIVGILAAAAGGAAAAALPTVEPQTAPTPPVPGGSIAAPVADVLAPTYETASPLVEPVVAQLPDVDLQKPTPPQTFRGACDPAEGVGAFSVRSGTAPAPKNCATHRATDAEVASPADPTDDEAPTSRLVPAAAVVAEPEPVPVMTAAAASTVVERPPVSVMDTAASTAPFPRGVDDAPAAALAIFALAAGILVVPLWVLYRRLVRRDVLTHDMRRRINDAVAEHPGLTAGAIARTVGVDRRTAVHHLTVLREFGHLDARRVGARIHFYRTGAAADPLERTAHAALRHEKARRVTAALLKAPGAGVTRAAELAGLPKSTTKWHMDRLRRLGVLDEQDRVRPQAVDALAGL